MPTSKTTHLLIQLLYPSTKILFYSATLQLPNLKHSLHISMASFLKTYMELDGETQVTKGKTLESKTYSDWQLSLKC